MKRQKINPGVALMAGKKIKSNAAEVPIDITCPEYERLKEKLKMFNNGIADDSKLTFDEFVSLVFETRLMEEKLNSKYDYLNVLKDEINQLEDELEAKYSMGLSPSKEDASEVIELRKKILKDSSAHLNGLY